MPQYLRTILASSTVIRFLAVPVLIIALCCPVIKPRKAVVSFLRQSNPASTSASQLANKLVLHRRLDHNEVCFCSLNFVEAEVLPKWEHEFPCTTKLAGQVSKTKIRSSISDCWAHKWIKKECKVRWMVIFIFAQFYAGLKGEIRMGL